MTIYQQWLDEGRPYWKGLSLLHQLPGMHPLKKTLGRGPSVYNSQKLQSVLRGHYASKPVPGSKAAPVPKPEPKVAATAELPPEPHSTSAYQGLPYHELPTPLQRWRIETTERHTKRRLLHARLRDEGETISLKERNAICRTITELTEHITEYWAAERAFHRTGAIPSAEPTEAERVAKQDPFRCQRELANQVRPRIYRLERRLREKRYANEDQRVGLEMQLQDQQRLRALLMDRIRHYDETRTGLTDETQQA